MRLHSVRLVNFRQHADTTIDFESGLTGIIGANGTGKSTILEAIAWALYGTPAVRGTRESIRSLRAAPRASVRVELDFELGNHRYRVVRGLNNAELFLDRAAAPIANSTTGVTDVLRRRLGMTLDEFFNTYFTGQKELSVMAAMGPTERAQFLSRLLGYERLRVAQELARERRKAITAEANGVKTGMPDEDVVRAALKKAEEQRDATREHLGSVQRLSEMASAGVAELTPRWEEVQAERERLQRIDADLRVAEGEETARKREIERQDRELSELEAARTELAGLQAAVEPLPALREELRTLDALALEVARLQGLVARQAELSGELSALQGRLAQLETAPTLEKQATADLRKRRADLVEREKAFDVARTEWVRDRQEAETTIEQVRLSLAENRTQRELVVKQGETGICPICARSLGDHYRTVLESLDEQIESLLERERYFTARIGQLARPPADVVKREAEKQDAADAVAKLEKKLAKITLGVQELSRVIADVRDRERKFEAIVGELAQVPAGYDEARHQVVRRTIGELQVMEARASKLAGTVEREAQLRTDREKAVASLMAASRRRADLMAEREALPDVDARFETIRKAFETATAAQRTAEVELATARAKHTSALAAYTVANTAVSDLEKAVVRLEELNRERRLHEELDRAYTDLRTELNLQLRPEISARASTLLAELTDGRYSELELDEGYDIIVHEDGIPKSVISGGEEDLANLVLRLSISQMIAERAGQPLSLLILDEVFGSLDDSRRNNVVDLLRRLHDRFEQVIVITHIDSVRDGLDRVIAVTYDEETGASIVHQDRHAIAGDDDQLEIGAA